MTNERTNSDPVTASDSSFNCVGHARGEELVSYPVRHQQRQRMSNHHDMSLKVREGYSIVSESKQEMLLLAILTELLSGVPSVRHVGLWNRNTSDKAVLP